MLAVQVAPANDRSDTTTRRAPMRLQRATRVVHVRQAQGLHLRVCSAIVSAVGSHRAEVVVERGSEAASAGSILELLSLAADAGTELVLSATGVEAQAALDAVAAVLTNDSPIHA
jgi:phosphocarrier protein HPr